MSEIYNKTHNKTSNHTAYICTDHNAVLTKRPPPMSPPMSQTWRVIWSVSRRWPSGKNSSRLEIMQTKAEGSRIRPTRRAHFPVQHMVLLFYLFLVLSSLLLLVPWWYFLLSMWGGSQQKVSETKEKRGEWDSRPVTRRKSNRASDSYSRKERGNKGRVSWFQTCVSSHECQ